MHTLQVYVVAKQGDDESEKPVIGSTIPLEVLVLQSSTGTRAKLAVVLAPKMYRSRTQACCRFSMAHLKLIRTRAHAILKLKFLKPSHPFQLVVRAKESPKGPRPNQRIVQARLLKFSPGRRAL